MIQQQELVKRFCFSSHLDCNNNVLDATLVAPIQISSMREEGKQKSFLAYWQAKATEVKEDPREILDGRTQLQQSERKWSSLFTAIFVAGGGTCRPSQNIKFAPFSDSICLQQAVCTRSS